MAKPIILTVDDDPGVSVAIARDLRGRYGADYQVVRASSGDEGLAVLGELAVRERPVALIASDQRMPAMTGVEFLGRAGPSAHGAKLVLLTAFADTDVAIRAINEIGLDYYLLKPWDPPEEKLYPVLDDLLTEWQGSRTPDGAQTVRVVGHRWSELTHETKTFLARNHVPYRWLDVEVDAEGQRLVASAGAGDEELPLVLLPDAAPLRAPSAVQLATALGLRTHAEQALYDLCIVGGGPAGLAAAVYGASEGLQTVVIERSAPGGQAGQSAAIENYLGFPKGLSGADLTHRAVAQARRFGAEMVLARDVVGFETRGPVRAVCFDDGTSLEARTVLVASGVSYRLMEAAGLDVLTGRGVYYGATASEARACGGDDVYVVGAANSAGQAAINFARYAKRVVLLVRSDRLEKSMSAYLVSRIRAAPNIEVRLRTVVAAGRGEGHLESLDLCDGATGDIETVPTNWLFVYIGASPRTEWLGDAVARDAKGFLLTGPAVATTEAPAARWPLERPPFPLETSLPGVFAAGDVRVDSMKRVASAVGEGAMAVHLVHQYLATV